MGGMTRTALVFATLLACATAAQAQDAVTRARELFDAADGAADEGRIADAMQLYQESLALSPRPGTAYNLAVVMLSAGRSVDAADTIRRLLAGEYGEVSGALRARGEALASEAERRISVLRLRLDGPSGSSLRIDGELLPDIELGVPLELRVDPGNHRLLARGPHGQLVEREVELVPGARREVEFAIEAVTEGSGAPEEAATRPDESEEDVWSEPWLHIGLGVALVAGVVALGLGVSGVFDPAPSDPVWEHAEALVRF